VTCDCGSEEKDQSSQIEEQLSVQEGMNNELDELSDQIQKNNENIQNKTQTLKTDILLSIEQIKKSNGVRCIIMSLIGIVILSIATVAMFVYFSCCM